MQFKLKKKNLTSSICVLHRGGAFSCPIQISTTLILRLFPLELRCDEAPKSSPKDEGTHAVLLNFRRVEINKVYIVLLLLPVAAASFGIQNVTKINGRDFSTGHQRVSNLHALPHTTKSQYVLYTSDCI